MISWWPNVLRLTWVVSSTQRTFHSSPMTPGDRLQQMPYQYHWAVADSALLQSIAMGQSVRRGPAGTRLNILVKLFAGIRLVYLLLFWVGVYELTKILIRQGRKSETSSTSCFGQVKQQYPSFFFVGFGAGPEEQLFASYCAEKSAPVARIDQVRIESMRQWHKVGVKQAIASLVRSLGTLRQAIASLPKECLPWRDDFLTFAGMRLGYFSFASAWFAQLKANAPNVMEVCFLAADTAAFAAVNAGLPTRYLQHGLSRHSLILPNFDRVDALTCDEVHHFQKRLPKADTRLVRPSMPPVAPQRPPCVLVASVYGDHDELQRILPFLEFASQIGLSIHVRPHPREDHKFWKSVPLPCTLTLEEHDATFDETLDRLRPALVVSWFSTALVDALHRGVIPVSVSSRNDQNIQDMVYPLFRHCLHWPGDRNLLKEIVADQSAYISMLSDLRVGIDRA